MKIIEKIEIKNFRSFCNRQGDKSEIDKISSLNIFSGANDSGKSNILRALNLFFNNQTNQEQFFSFENDYFKKDIKSDEKDIKEELVTIRITFLNTKNRGKNATQKDKLFLPEHFWVSRKFTKNSKYSTHSQSSGVETSFKKEKGSSYFKFIDSKTKKLTSNFSASLTKQLTDFLDSIQYHYIPAIKDQNYFSHLYGELRQTLLKAKDSNVDTKKGDFEKAIQQDTEILMLEFKKMLGDFNANIAPIFELPDLVNLFQSLNVQTGKIPLRFRGDGVQAKLIPEILNFISVKEQALTSKKIKSGQKAKKYFIWGFEEPENSYEYKNAHLLANRFKNVFVKNAQIFITTHSFNFLSLDGNGVVSYRIWRDEKIKASRITKIKRDVNGRFQFEGDDFKTDSEKLNEELGVFQLNKDLENLYIETEKRKDDFVKKIKIIKKPILYTEGNNVVYIKKAKEFFSPGLDFDIESLGGKNDIKKFFTMFRDSNFDRFKIIFIFDCDAETEFSCCENKKTDYLSPFIFKKNTKNIEEELQCGIENLFDSELFLDEKRFFSITETNKDGKIISRKRILRKQEFKKYICEERKIEDDFKNFNPLFDKINELFK
ncbi:MAG: AAA family ATPase [Patescibacteria group bacterium]